MGVFNGEDMPFKHKHASIVQMTKGTRMAARSDGERGVAIFGISLHNG